MKKISFLLPIILLISSIKPAFSQVKSLSDWHVPVPSNNSDQRVPPPVNNYPGKGLPGLSMPNISFPELMEALPPVPDGGPPSTPSPYFTGQLKKVAKNKRVSDADDEYIANLVKKAVANLKSSCCCCCCSTPLINKPLYKKKKVFRSGPAVRKRKLSKPVKKTVTANTPKVKIRYVVRYKYKYIPNSCNCAPNAADTAKINR